MANSTPQHRNSNSKDLEAEDDYQEKRRLKAKNHELRQKQIAYRRDTVFSLSSRGLSQYKIAKILRVTQPLINQDIAYLRLQFRETLKQHIEYELPLIYNQSMFGISEVIEHAYTIYHKDEVPEQIKLHALELISDCQQRRLDMATSGSIIEQGVAYVGRMRSNLNHLVRAIPEDEVREMLHEEIGNDDTSGERNDESSGFTGVDAVDNPNGIDDSSIAATPLEDQSDESLSLPDSNNTSAITDDNDNVEEHTGDTSGSTTNTVF
jgi:hypothetical protein